MAREFNWHTDVIDCRVIEATLIEVAGRLDILREHLAEEKSDSFSAPLKVPTAGNPLSAEVATIDSPVTTSCQGFRSTVSY